MNAYRVPSCFLMAAPPFQPMLSRQALALITCVAWALAGCRDSGPTGPSTGWISIATTTTGGNLDPDGYAVTVDRGTAQVIAVNAHSINMATSIAGVTDAIVVDPATLSYATAAGLSLIADTRTMTYSQVYAQYGSQFN